MPYSKQTWVDGEGGGTPFTAARGHHIEFGIAAAHDDLVAAKASLDADVAALQASVAAKVAASDPRLSDARPALAHSHTKAEVGLPNVDNTSDASKPVSAAVAAELAGKADSAHTHAVTGGIVGGVALDSFTGADDDAKLTAALSYVAAQTVKPPILFSNRQYSFSQSGRTVFSGMKLTGAFGHGNQQRAANSIPNDIRYTGAGTWWTMPAGSNVFDVGLYGLSFQGNSGAQFMATGTAVLWSSVFRDLGFNLWKHVLGNPSQSVNLTANLFDGWWNVNNSYNTSFTIGGSDNNLWMQGMLLDSPATTMDNTTYHMRLAWLSKTTIGPLYITGDKMSGVLISGPTDGTANPITFFGNGRIEGRNKNAPTYGSCIRIDGGRVNFRDWWIGYGASALNTTGHTGEGGVITMTGGHALFDGCTYSRATSVAETVPWIYQTGGELRVRDVWACADGGSWTDKPRVRSLGGTASADTSVTLVTV